jgi:FkbM family methyltransferase
MHSANKQSIKSGLKLFIEDILHLKKRQVCLGDSNYFITSNYKNSLFRFLRRNFEHEEKLVVILRKVFRVQSGTFIDVGANIGQTLANVLKLEWDREYIGFEPQIRGCMFIQDLIMENGLKKKIILPIGLSNRTAVEKLKFNAPNDIAASFIDEYRPGGFYKDFSHILTMSGDDALELLGGPDVGIIKIDVEGAELEVMQGFSATLEVHKPYIFFEVLPHYLLMTNAELDSTTRKIREERHESISSFLHSANYELFQIRSADDIRKVDKLIADNRIGYNYVAVPEMKVVNFMSQLNDTLK